MHIPKNIALHKEGQYCIKCFAPSVHRIFKDGLTYYYCENCGKVTERSLTIDNKIVWWVDKTTGEYWHESVGILVFNNEDKSLFFERTIYPFALTIPAGHLDAGEDPKMAAKRELQEETGITTNKVRLFSEEDVFGDKCRRGADNHKWHLYTTKVESTSWVKINDEGVKPAWLTLDEALQEKLVYPVRFFIEKYGSELQK